jgi:CRP/FNR family cyclic AMP-dependent transcriptional regulator
MAIQENDAPALVSATGQAAPASLAAALSAAGQLLHARPGQLLLSAGTRSDDVYLVRSGTIRVTLYSGDGREVIIRDQGRGNFFGELAAVDGGRRSTSIVAVAQSQLLVVPAAQFRSLIAATPESALWFAAHLVERVRSLTERVFELSTLNVRSRLHSQLLRLCADAGVNENRAMLDPAPTHEVLATMIGTHREAVTRELRDLATRGIVKRGRKRIEVRDVALLATDVRKAVGNESGYEVLD